MTPWMLAAIALATVGQIVYQIGQRAVPQNASPLVVLSIAYFAAGTLCVALAWLTGALNGAPSWRIALGWPTALIAVSIVGIEIGYLIAYRSGWTIGSAFASESTVTIFALALIGRFAFGNPLSLRQMLGLLLSSAAIWLLTA